MVTFVRLRENVELRNTRPQTCKSQEKGTAGMVRKYKLTGVRDGLVCMYRCVWRGHSHMCAIERYVPGG